jgi:hypothetical protein
VAGLVCRAYLIKGPATKTVHAGRDGLLLFSEVSTESNRAILRAVAVRTGIPVGTHLFRVPEGFLLTVP